MFRKLKALAAAGIFVFGLGLSLEACAPAQVSQTISSVDQAMTSLSQTPAGKNILAWLDSLKAKAQASLAKFNAGLPNGGLSSADVQDLCAMDNTAHTVLLAVELLYPVPSQAVLADNVAHQTIAAACAAASSGQAPSVGDLTVVATGWNNLLTALGVKL